VSLSLPQLLDRVLCPKVGEAEIQYLAKTKADKDALRALAHLWLSLGQPTSSLWRETRVFCNRILDSYDSASNVPAHRRRANDVRLSTETRSRRSVQPVCSAMCVSTKSQLLRARLAHVLQ
jgi:hypothetical protein